MNNPVAGLIFVVLLIAGFVVGTPIFMAHQGLGAFLGMFWVFASMVIASGVRMAAQWEKGVVFQLGKLSRVKGPGLFFIIPIVEEVRNVDMRVLTMDIPAQQVITRDNVPVKINGVIFFKVDDPANAIIKVQDYRYAISQYAQTSLRDVIGQMSLDQLLTEREEIGKKIEANVEKDTEAWGLEVTGIR
ncbi:MAG: slipin family protein, partial [Candidatus Omnitrophica bacterium]|nr:slipin family protein [Candidatus Omnitrophota bacterium]